MTESNNQKNMVFSIKEIDINKIEKNLTYKTFFTAISIPFASYFLSFFQPELTKLININHYVLSILLFVYFKFAVPTLILITTLCPYCNKSVFPKKICASKELKNIIRTTSKCNYCGSNVHLISRHNDPL